eukprot:10227294-Alexandrium_andersonii.AAC.1
MLVRGHQSSAVVPCQHTPPLLFGMGGVRKGTPPLPHQTGGGGPPAHVRDGGGRTPPGKPTLYVVSFLAKG